MPEQSRVVDPPLPRTRRHRFTSLDGLRGLCALVVVLHHSARAFPVFQVPYTADKVLTDPGSFAWVLIYTPAHLLWEGTSAVYVFFVLSGFVLAVQTDRYRLDDWLRYYPRRLLRLYLPVWGAVALGLALRYLVPRDAPVASPWLHRRSLAVTGRQIVDDVTLVNGAGRTNSVLWSLQWEVLFSLLLPLYVIVLRRLRSVPYVGIVGGLALVFLASFTESQALLCLPMFALGIALWFGFEHAQRLARSLEASRWSRVWWLLLLATALSATVFRWFVEGAHLLGRLGHLTETVATAGSLLLVVLVAVAPGIGSFFDRAWLQWLGKISFSLYLVHEIVLVTVIYAIGDEHRLVALALAVPLALVVAAAFHRVVEAPSQRLARWIGTPRARGEAHEQARPAPSATVGANGGSGTGGRPS